MTALRGLQLSHGIRVRASSSRLAGGAGDEKAKIIRALRQGQAKASSTGVWFPDMPTAFIGDERHVHRYFRYKVQGSEVYRGAPYLALFLEPGFFHSPL